MACCPGWSGRWCSQFALISRRSFRLPAGQPRRRRPAPHPHFGYASHIRRGTLTSAGSPDAASRRTPQNQRSSLALPSRASSPNALTGSAGPGSAAAGGGVRWSWRVLGKYLDLMMRGARGQASLGLQGDRVDHRSRDLSSCRLTYSGPMPCRVRDPRGPAPVRRGKMRAGPGSHKEDAPGIASLVRSAYAHSWRTCLSPGLASLDRLRQPAVLVGRGGGYALIGALLDRAAAGGALPLRGEPGADRTVLLDAAADGASVAGSWVLRAGGARELADRPPSRRTRQESPELRYMAGEVPSAPCSTVSRRGYPRPAAATLPPVEPAAIRRQSAAGRHLMSQRAPNIAELGFVNGMIITNPRYTPRQQLLGSP
jgi:hypothetical protein